MNHALQLEHRFIAGQADAPTLLLLHGTGGDEHDLVPLGQAVRPGASLLSPRGAVLEHGQPRFFRRLAEGVFDLPDLHRRTADLAAFVAAAAGTYGFDPRRVVALGFSNGANIAASLLLSGTGTLAGAVLLRPMVPFEPEVLPRLHGIPVLISAGRADPIIPAGLTTRLEEVLTKAGATVETLWQPVGHGLTQADVTGAGDFLARNSEKFGVSSLT